MANRQTIYRLLSIVAIMAGFSSTLIFPADASNPQSTVSYSNSTGPVVSATLTGTTSNDKAIYGYASGTSGTVRGVYGKSNGSNGYGVYGQGRYGVYGETTVSGGIGVWGAASSSTGSSKSVYGWNYSSSGTGVYGEALAFDGTNYGVYGKGTSTSGRGVYGYVSATSGTTYGVYGKTSSSSGYGVYSYGKFAATGTKSAIVRTADGPTELYTEESTEVWFTDYGTDRLENGRVHIDLDSHFLDTVRIDLRHPMMVFVQMEGEANPVYVEKGEDGFDVVESKRGKSNAAFSYRVVAKRADYEDLRLKVVDVDLDPKPDDEGRPALPEALE